MANQYADVQSQLTEIQGMQASIARDLQQATRPQYGALGTMQKSLAMSSHKPGDSPFKSFDHFLKSVMGCNMQTWQQHPEMSAYEKSFRVKYKTSPIGLSETTGADGGFLVPPEFSNQLLMRVYSNDLLGRTTLMPMGGPQLSIPAINESSRADGSRFGGVLAYWTGEANTVTATKPNFAQIKLNLSKLLMFVRCTEELLTDSNMALQTYLDTVAAAEFEFKIGDSLINGDGVEKPQGILQSPSKISVAKDPGQTAATVTLSNLANMWARLHPSCHANAVWLIDPSVSATLMQLQVGYIPVYMPPGGASDKPYLTLFGRPVITTEFQPSVGTSGDVILTDLSTHLTGTRGGMQSAVSIHAYWLTDEQSFRFSYRMDARNWWLNPLTPKNGDTTRKLSNIVVLDNRS